MQGNGETSKAKELKESTRSAVCHIITTIKHVSKNPRSFDKTVDKNWSPTESIKTAYTVIPARHHPIQTD